MRAMSCTRVIIICARDLVCSRQEIHLTHIFTNKTNNEANMTKELKAQGLKERNITMFIIWPLILLSASDYKTCHYKIKKVIFPPRKAYSMTAHEGQKSHSYGYELDVEWNAERLGYYIFLLHLSNFSTLLFNIIRILWIVEDDFIPPAMCVCMHRLTWWMKMQNIDLSMIGNQCTEGWNKMICTNLSVPAEGFATIFLSSWEHDRDFLTKSGRKRLTVSKAGDIKEVQRLKLGCFFDIHKR